MRGVFVTGTDTGIGKTVVSSILLAALRRVGPVGYWKPVQTGIEQDNDTAEVTRLASCPEEEIVDLGVRLPRPVSPHLAARLAGRKVAIGELVPVARGLDKDRFWIVEGAGGLLVPLNDRETIADLIETLAMPALVVSRSGLGTINHTLLTLNELRRRPFPIAGVAMVGPRDPENRKAIESFGMADVLLEVPPLRGPEPEEISALANDASAVLRKLAA